MNAALSRDYDPIVRILLMEVLATGTAGDLKEDVRAKPTQRTFKAQFF